MNVYQTSITSFILHLTQGINYKNISTYISTEPGLNPAGWRGIVDWILRDSGSYRFDSRTGHTVMAKFLIMSCTWVWHSHCDCMSGLGWTCVSWKGETRKSPSIQIYIHNYYFKNFQVLSQRQRKKFAGDFYNCDDLGKLSFKTLNL